MSSHLVPSDPENVVAEIIHARQKNSRVFQMRNGTRKVIARAAPVRELDDDGETIVPISDGFVEKAGEFVTRGPQQSITRFHKLSPRYDTSIRGKVVSAELDKIAGLPPGPFTTSLVNDGRILEYDFHLHDIKMHLYQSGRGVHRLIVLNSENSPRSFTTRIHEQNGSSHKFNPVSTAQDANNHKARIQTNVGDVTNVRWLNKPAKRFDYQEQWTGEIRTIPDRQTRRRNWSTNPTYPVKIDPTTEFDTNASNDVQSRNYFGAGFYDMNSTGSLVRNGFLVATKTFEYQAGFRFPTVSVSGATAVTTANLKLFIRQANGVSAISPLTIKAHADRVADAAPWGLMTSPVKSQIATGGGGVTAQVTATGTQLITLGVTADINAILGLGGWADGNDIKFGVWGTNMPTMPWGTKLVEFEAYDHYGSNEAILELVFAAGGGGGGESHPRLIESKLRSLLRQAI